MNELCWASREDDLDEVIRLLDTGADVNASNNYGRTPLHEAAWNDNTAVAELLIAKGADVNAADGDGKTPLYWAARYDNVAVAELLRKHGAK